jgi:hypothetical protein
MLHRLEELPPVELAQMAQLEAEQTLLDHIRAVAAGQVQLLLLVEMVARADFMVAVAVAVELLRMVITLVLAELVEPEFVL